MPTKPLRIRSRTGTRPNVPIELPFPVEVVAEEPPDKPEEPPERPEPVLPPVWDWALVQLLASDPSDLLALGPNGTIKVEVTPGQIHRLAELERFVNDERLAELGVTIEVVVSEDDG
jgi:hypothetical protein